MEYPEHDRLHLIEDQSQAIYDFLEWLYDTKGAWLVKMQTVTEHRPCLGPGCRDGKIAHRSAETGKRVETDCPTCEGTNWHEYEVEKEFPFVEPKRLLLAEFFNIDLDLLESEKVHMLEAQRELNRHVTK